MRQDSWLEKENQIEAVQAASGYGAAFNQGGPQRSGSQKGRTVKKPRDPNLDNPAVKKYREIVHLQWNHIQCDHIAYVVEDSPRGLRIWEATILEHMGHGWNPKDVLTMLKNYRVMTAQL